VKSRREIFGTWHHSSQAFVQAAAASQASAHLNNPSGRQPFHYLTDYLSQLSQNWWQLSPPEMEVLDWGCGLGQVSFLLQELGFRPTSADLPDYPCRVFLEHAGLGMVNLEHEWQLPFEPNSFHVVTSFGVLEHVSQEVESLREIRRILKPGGLFFCVNLPRSFSWTQRVAHLQGNYYHDRLYRRRDVHKLMKEVNFGILEMWERQVFPKNTIRYFKPDLLERLDQGLCDWTPLRWLSTCLEFVAYKL
jgi:2-polyprenyl-3-methyl-5-hydroxy-6-metoxy-1,4-benzoquinol methylase